MEESPPFVVVGGGIAGSVCAEELCRIQPHQVVLVTGPQHSVKGVQNVQRLARSVELFDVVEKSLADLQQRANLRVVDASATRLDAERKMLTLDSGDSIHYSRLCLANGALPRAVLNHPHVLCLRDTTSVQQLATELQSARRILLAGNGGIAMELVHTLTTSGVEVVWAVRNEHVGDAVFDIDAARFLLTELRERVPVDASAPAQPQNEQRPGPAVSSAAEEWPQVPASKEKGAKGVPPPEEGVTAPSLPEERKQHGGSLHFEYSSTVLQGHRGLQYSHAVGPRWTSQLESALALGSSEAPTSSGVQLELGCSLTSLEACEPGEGEGRVLACLSNGKQVPVDLVVSAVGVAPDTAWLPSSTRLAPDGGVLVNRDLQTSLPDVYAAGDVCTLPEEEQAPLWFQKRLWTQARHMGLHAAHVMSGLEAQHDSSFSLELFSHCTRFFDFKVVLLGLYNGQRLGAYSESDIVSYARSTEGPNGTGTFVRVLLLQHKMVGAVLVGDTDLEELCENLILGGTDLSPYGASILDPDVDLADMFD